MQKFTRAPKNDSIEMTTSVQCRKCPHKETTTNKHYILPLPVKELCLKSKKGILLQDYVMLLLYRLVGNRDRKNHANNARSKCLVKLK